ncbi:MAG: ATP-binding protein [Candidatus Melainabacteria bacterium]|nr:ATP-binding protein [Candidatus Melainabacteria bacterium]
MDGSTNVVLTSGPNAGKTTLIRAFQKLGFPVIEEMATEVIREGRYSPIINPLEFRKETLARQKAAELALVSDSRTVIQDRGAYDGQAYCEATGCPEPTFLSELESGIYPLAFVLDPVLSWDDDGIRYEDVDFTYKINPILARRYRNAGAHVVHIPLMPVQDRVDMILSVLREHNNCRR